VPVPVHAASPDAVPARATAFVTLALLCSWVPWGVLAALGGDPAGSAVATLLWVLGGLGPGLAAVLLLWRTAGRSGLRWLWHSLRRWRVGRSGWLLLLPLPVGVVGVLLLAAADRVVLEVDLVATLALVPAFLATGVVLGGLEEVGWRGYLQPLLQTRARPFTAAALVGVVWAVWHAPLFLLEGTSQAAASVAGFTLGALALSTLFAWVWNVSGGNVLLLVLLHAAVNGWYGAAVHGLAPAVSGADFGTVTAALAAVLALGLLLRVGPDLGARTAPVDRMDAT